MLEMLALNKQYYLSWFYGINPGGVTPKFIPLWPVLISNWREPNWRGYRTPLIVMGSSLRIVPVPTGGNLSYPPSGISKATTWVLHAHQLPPGSSPNHIVLGEVCSDTICNIPDCFQDCRLTPQTNTSLSSVFCPHSHAYRETSR